MLQFQGKTVEEALEQASQELNKDVDDILYEVLDKKKGIFNKKIIIEVYEFSDIVRYAEDYVLGITDAIGIESTVNTRLDDDIMHITIDSTHNPILIGQHGKTLQALNDLTRLAVAAKFHKHFRILLDVSGYKDRKYSIIAKNARRYAKEVQSNKQTYVFDPMPSDERRAIHNAISNMKNVKTESVGEGNKRRVQIIYVED